jgi:hypothetical protein
MIFFSNFFNSAFDINRLEKQAIDVLQLSDNLKAFRIKKEIIVVDIINNKVIKKIKDSFPSNHSRAIVELKKKLNLTTKQKTEKKSEIWTCSFRDTESRWVWYKNSQPQITLDFKEAYRNEELENKLFFHSARYGTNIIEKIKTSNIESVAKEINATIIEKPFVTVKCSNCQTEDNYTIDDLVDINKKASYNSNLVVCLNCDSLINLL